MTIKIIETPPMQNTDHSVLIIIPAYNEEETIASVLEDIADHMETASVVVVDDGSQDATPLIARKMGAVVLQHPFNMGVGAAMQTGFKYALQNGYTICVQVDADGQHPASEIPKLLEPIKRGEANVVVGSRFLEPSDYRPSIARGMGIGLFSRVVSAILDTRITDATSGFRAVDLNAIRFLKDVYPDDYPEVEALVLLHKGGFDIMEVPVKMRSRQGGKSSITATRSLYYLIKVLLAIMVDTMKKIER